MSDVTIMGRGTAERDRPDTPGAAHEAMAQNLQLVRDVAGGYPTLRARSTTYLPRHPKEEGSNYSTRLNRPVFYNTYSRTIDGLTGMVFRRDPVLGEDVPDVIKGQLETVDNAGTHFDVFSREVFRDALEGGHAAILVDMPNVTAETLAEEQDRGLRPYWIAIRAENIWSWRTVQVDGQTKLEQVVLREFALEPDGRFGEKTVERFRVYTRGLVKVGDAEPKLGVSFEVWEKDDKDMLSRTALGALGNLAEIPLVPVYGRKVGLLRSKPPLLDLAFANLLHYQTASDYFHAHHIACVPMLATIGAGGEGEVTIGPNTVLELPDGGKAEWVETSGAALGHSRELLQDQEGRMATLGLNMLAREKRAAETAQAKRIDKSEGDSALAVAARSCQDALEQCLMFHAQFIGLGDGGSVTINRDFENLSLDADQIKAYSAMAGMSQLSLESLWSVLAEGGALPETFDPEVEQVRLEAEMLPGAA